MLADENFPLLAVEALRRGGHDVRWVRTDAPGSSDRDVLVLAAADQRVVITFDRDFGELVVGRRDARKTGVILFRISPSSPGHVADVALAVLASRDDWADYFSVVEEDRIRMILLSSIE